MMRSIISDWDSFNNIKKKYNTEWPENIFVDTGTKRFIDNTQNIEQLSSVRDENSFYYNLYDYKRAADIGIRWEAAELSGKWSKAADQGFAGLNISIPAWVTSEVDVAAYISQDYHTVALNEIKWCLTHCFGRFARRYSNIERSYGSGSTYRNLSIMMFEIVEDAVAFTVLLKLKYGLIPYERNTIVKVSGGFLYYDSTLMLAAATSSLLPPAYLNNNSKYLTWCKENCMGKYFISTTMESFIFFTLEEDAVLFKFTYLLDTTADPNDN